MATHFSILDWRIPMDRGAWLATVQGVAKRQTQQLLSTAHRRSGEAAEKSNPLSKERRLHWHRRAERSYSMSKVRRGSREEGPLVQGKEQWLRFAGAAVKRYPTSKVR